MSRYHKAVAFRNTVWKLRPLPSTRPIALSNGRFFVDGLILLGCIIPLFLTKHLPLSDLPNHLARQYIFQGWASSPALQSIYTFRLKFVPNLALEGFVYALSTLVSIDVAVRLFCVSTIALLFLGTRFACLAFNDGRSTLYRATPLLCYGGAFQFGFLSFCLGIALAVLSFGLYVKRSRTTLPVAIVVFLPISLLLMCCHLVAFGLFALAVAGFEFSDVIARSHLRGSARVALAIHRGLRLASFLLPPLVLMLAAGGSGPVNGPMVVWGTVQQKVESVVAITLFSSPVIELPLLVLAGIGLSIALAVRAVQVRPCGYVILPMLAVTWLAAPRAALGSGYLDYRLPWAMTFFLVALLSPGTRWQSYRAPIALWFLGLSLIRIVSISMFWLSWEPIIDTIDMAFNHLPVGSRMAVVESAVPSTSESRRPSLLHVAAYAVARRQAYEPQIYAGIAGQILQLQPPYRRLQMMTPPTTLGRIDPVFDHLLVIDPAAMAIPKGLALVASGKRFALYRIEGHTRGRGQSRIIPVPIPSGS